jgi:outer membrane protein TolC
MKIYCPRLSLAILPILLLLLSSCLKPDYLPGFDTELLYRKTPEPVDPLPGSPQTGAQVDVEESLAAPESGNLDLAVEQAVQLALRNNRDLKVEQINPVIAGTFEAIERGVFDPEIFGDLEFSREESSEVGSNGSRTAIKEDEQSAQFGLRQYLPSGTQLEASVGQSANDTDAEAKEQAVRAGISLTQSLLRGSGPTVNLVSLRQAELEREISEFELRGVIETLLAATEIAYWNHVLAARKIDIFESSLAIARQQLDEIQTRIEVGTLPRIEAAAADAEVARREQALIDVRSSLEESRLRLLRLINPGRTGRLDIQLLATSKPEVNPTTIAVSEERLQLADKSRPELNEARLRLRQNRLETIQTRNGLLPRLDLFISLGKSGYAESFSGAFKDLDENNHDFRVGIQLSQYLNKRQAKGLDLAVRAAWRQSSEAVENLKQLVELDVRLAVNEFERSRQQIAATRVTHLLQEKTLEAEKERFDVGSSTALQVAQAQRDLLVSAIDEIEALINCRQALVKLYLAEGSLLERRGVRLAESSRRLK